MIDTILLYAAILGLIVLGMFVAGKLSRDYYEKKGIYIHDSR